MINAAVDHLRKQADAKTRLTFPIQILFPCLPLWSWRNIARLDYVVMTALRELLSQPIKISLDEWRWGRLTAEYEREKEREHCAVEVERLGVTLKLIICHLSSNQGLNISFPLSTGWKDELCRPGQLRWCWIIKSASGNLAGPPAESNGALSSVTGGLCLNNSCPPAIWLHPSFRSLLLKQLLPVCFSRWHTYSMTWDWTPNPTARCCSLINERDASPRVLNPSASSSKVPLHEELNSCGLLATGEIRHHSHFVTQNNSKVVFATINLSSMWPARKLH